MIQLPLLYFEKSAKEKLEHTLSIYEYCDPNIMSIGILVIYILLQYTQLQTLLHRFDDSFGAKLGFTLLYLEKHLTFNDTHLHVLN